MSKPVCARTGEELGTMKSSDKEDFIPSEIAHDLLSALKTISQYKLGRVKDGWQAPGSPKVPRRIAGILKAKRLIIRGYRNGRFRLELTASGQRTLHRNNRT